MNYTIVKNDCDMGAILLTFAAVIVAIAVFGTIYICDLTYEEYEKKIKQLTEVIQELQNENDRMAYSQDEQARLTEMTKKFVESFADTLNSSHSAGIKRRRLMSMSEDD